MCYPVYGMVYIKDPLLLTKKNSVCTGSSRFPLSLSEWSFTICPMPYKHKNVSSALLNKTFHSFTSDVTKAVVCAILSVGWCI